MSNSWAILKNMLALKTESGSFWVGFLPVISLISALI